MLKKPPSMDAMHETLWHVIADSENPFEDPLIGYFMFEGCKVNWEPVFSVIYSIGECCAAHKILDACEDDERARLEALIESAIYESGTPHGRLPLD